jgi:N-acetylglucosaminyldiphosphoundecaprenol N-acetyl-beta-D-mannosaminyltransferase
MLSLRIRKLGVSVPLVESMGELERVVTTLATRDLRGSYFVAINPEKLVTAHRDTELQQIFSDSAANFADGVGVTLALRFLTGQTVQRITGVETLPWFLKFLDERQGSVFLFGGQEDVNRRAADQIAKTYPGIRVVGRQSGYDYSDEELNARINAAQPDLLVVALGSPRQEKWIYQHGRSTRARFLLGVGGSLDVLVGDVRRAPALFRRCGLEWFYRLVSQPSRLRRQKALPLFALSVLRERFG